MTTHAADEMAELLATGARAADSPFLRAANHLFTFIDLPGRRDFDAYVEIADVDLDGKTVRVAWVRDWHRLGRLGDLGHLHGGARGSCNWPPAWPTASRSTCPRR